MVYVAVLDLFVSFVVDLAYWCLRLVGADGSHVAGYIQRENNK